MLHCTELGAFREEFVEVAAPARGVLALAIAAYSGPIEDHLEAAPGAARGFRFVFPDRAEGSDHEVRIHVGHRHCAEHRATVSLEGVGPLVHMLAVAPA